MKKIMNWMLAAILICGASIFTSCTSGNDDNPVNPVDNLAEKMLGKWIESEINGQPAMTNEKTVTTFLSATEAIVSSSKNDYTETQVKWNSHQVYEVEVDGNKITLIGSSNKTVTLVNEYIVTSITPARMDCKFKHTTIRNGEVINTTESYVRLVKVAIDYSLDIIGAWEGQMTSEKSVFGDEGFHRWEFKADGNYLFYDKSVDGQWQKLEDVFAEYFVDGNLLCARWKNAGEGMAEKRDWWEIESIENGIMKWKALRRNEDGSTYTSTFEMTLVR